MWNPDQKQTIDFYDSWQKMPDNIVHENGFKAEWEMFIRHVVEDAPFKNTLVEGAKGVQLVECCPSELEGTALGRRSGAQDLRGGNMSIIVPLPAADGRLAPYPCPTPRTFPIASRGRLNRVALAAAHVVADPHADIDPWLQAAPDWERTIAYREYLWDLGLGGRRGDGTAQRGRGSTGRWPWS